MRFPVSRNPRLAKGTADQLNNIEISPFGLHWPDLDEDLIFSEGLLKETSDSIKRKNAQQGAASRLSVRRRRNPQRQEIRDCGISPVFPSSISEFVTYWVNAGVVAMISTRE